MSSNIRFHVHEEEYFEETILDQVIDVDRSPDALFAIINMLVVLEPILNILDPIQVASENEITLNITSQPYNSTDKKYDNYADGSC